MNAGANDTAVVTGGATGIGRAISRRLAGDGFHVVVTDIADGTETVEAITTAGGSAEFREADVREADDLAAAFEGLDLAALVNNAAYYAPLVGAERKRRFDAIPEDEWDTVMATNVKGTFLASKHALDRFGADGGAIVNLSSGTVLSGRPGFLHYVTSKAAVLGLTRAMANEVGDRGIRVNAVMPGFTASEASLQAGEAAFEQNVERQAIGRRLEPGDVADVVSFLASNDAGMVTGQVVNVDGGARFY